MYNKLFLVIKIFFIVYKFIDPVLEIIANGRLLAFGRLAGRSPGNRDVQNRLSPA